MTNKITYPIAGWLCFINASLILPFFTLSVISKVMKDRYPSTWITVDLIELIMLCFGLYVFLATKKLFNQYFGVYSLDRLISYFIGIFILFIILRVLHLSAVVNPNTLSGLTIIVGLAASLRQIIYGIKLSKLDNSLFGYKKTYAYLTITEGVLMMTIVLSPIAILVSILTSIYAGKIFFCAASETSHAREDEGRKN